MIHDNKEVSFIISESLYELNYVPMVALAHANNLFEESLVSNKYLILIAPSSLLCSRVESYLCGVSLAILCIFGQTDFTLSSLSVFGDCFSANLIMKLGLIFGVFI